MTRGVSAFPSPFGLDSDLMFAGNGTADPSPAPGDLAVVVTPQTSRTPVKSPRAARRHLSRGRRRETSAGEITPAPFVHHAPFRLEPAKQARQTVKLGRRGFHLRSRATDGAGTEGEAAGQSIIVPTAIVGVILASASYFFNFIG
ncbi:MAG TPA: hypothetical protein VIN77_09800 [Aurantimonas sp.]